MLHDSAISQRGGKKKESLANKTSHTEGIQKLQLVKRNGKSNKSKKKPSGYIVKDKTYIVGASGEYAIGDHQWPTTG